MEVILGIFLIGIVVIYLLPGFNRIFLNLNKAREDTQLVYLAESIVESLKFERIHNPEIFKTFEKKDSILYTNLDQEDLNQYNCLIVKEDETDYLWTLRIIVSRKREKGRGSNIEIKASFPK